MVSAGTVVVAAVTVAAVDIMFVAMIGRHWFATALLSTTCKACAVLNVKPLTVQLTNRSTTGLVLLLRWYEWWYEYDGLLYRGFVTVKQ